MVPAIECDRTGRPQVELWGDWLHRVDIPEFTLALPLGDMGGVYHIHHFDLWRKLLLSSCFRWPGLLVITITLQPLLLVLSI